MLVWKTFSNNYDESSDKEKCMQVMNLVHECINEDSTKRPLLGYLESSFSNLIK